MKKRFTTRSVWVGSLLFSLIVLINVTTEDHATPRQTVKVQPEGLYKKVNQIDPAIPGKRR